MDQNNDHKLPNCVINSAVELSIAMLVNKTLREVSGVRLDDNDRLPISSMIGFLASINIHVTDDQLENAFKDFTLNTMISIKDHSVAITNKNKLKRYIEIICI